MCAVALARCIADADLPPGVFNLVTGPGPVVGDEIARNPGTDGVAFIGSTATGRLVAEAAAGKAALLEMGGNGPLVVMDDADLEAAADATLTACYLCAGQSCTAGERILVHRAIHDEYVELLARRVTERILLGDPFDDATTMGPLNNEPVAQKMDEHVGDAVERGADLVSGGARASGFPTGLYWQPTVLANVPSDSRVAVEETFGPIAPVVAIDSLEDAITLTNSSPYGLLSAIFTADLNAGLEFADRVRTGWVNINESSNYWESHLPFGGRAGTDSGIGRVGGAHVMHSFTELQTVVLTPHGRRVSGGRSEDRADLPLECDHVLADDVLRARGVSGGDRVQDVVVLVDTGEHVGETVDHQVPDADREVEVAAECRLEVRVTGAAVDEPVDPQIKLHQRRAVI